MNDCGTLDQSLDDYLAGRLTEAEAALLEEHAGGCDRCAELLERRTRLPITLAPAFTPPPAVRAAVLAVLPAGRRSRLRWLVPPAIAAMLILTYVVTHPEPKRAQGRPADGVPSALAASRADGEFARLAAARAEVEGALAARPHDKALRDALDRLDHQRRILEDIVREYES